MKHIAAVVLSAAALCAAADEEYISPITGKPIPRDSKYTLEQIKERDERVLKKTGGFVEVEAKGTSVIVVDTRERPAGAPVQFEDVFASLSKTNVKVERSPLKAGETAFGRAAAALSDGNVGYAIAIVENDTDRGLTVYPEDRIAVINASRYRGGDDPLKPETRLHKEIWRALGFVAGIGYAPFPNDVLQPVFSVAELDGLTYQVMQPMNFQKMYSALSKLGVTRSRRLPYRIAVQEGWAPAPTNDVQKAIWEKVKAEKSEKPSKPIKVNYDPKTAPKIEK